MAAISSSSCTGPYFRVGFEPVATRCPGGGPQVNVIDVASLNQLQVFFGFADAFLGGVFVA